MLNFKSFTRRISCKTIRENFKLSMDVVDSVAKIQADDWTGLAKYSTVFLGLPYLFSIEKGMADKLGYRYITYYNNDKPVGIAIFQLTELENKLINSAGDLSTSKSLGKKLIEKINLNMLVSGSIYNSGAPSYYFDQTVMSNDEAVEAITEGVSAILASDGCKSSINVLLMKEFYAKKTKNDNKFKDYSFAEFCLEPNMILGINEGWNSYDDYLNDMTAKYRNKSTATYKKSTDIIAKDFSASEIEEYSDVIEKLYNQVYEKANFKLGKLELETFVWLKKELQELFVFKTYWLDTNMIGFSTAILDKTELSANYIGIDYDFIKSHAIYQRILYDFVEMAIDLNLQSINLGRTAGEIKSTIGAKAKDCLCYIRMKNSVSNHFLKPIVNSLENPDFSERNPFKKGFSVG